jgi:hypothetical protein
MESRKERKLIDNALIFKLLSLSKGLNARRKEGVSKQGKSRTARIIIIKLF